MQIVHLPDLPHGTPQIIRRPTVERKSGLSKSQIYALMADGKFPRPVSLGNRAVGWVASSVDNWITSRPIVDSLPYATASNCIDRGLLSDSQTRTQGVNK
ncbi:AlpA family transcriptional regulator [Caenimonas sp. SL110]|uniref:AlpA family transcriptional regulator n=1 Tax=Caenimonas sp. SL110 TaxID=1450524 RepID=UPI0009E2EAEA|nr:AlpA family transcriptional regulator [Caenimonas sp. SL110]